MLPTKLNVDTLFCQAVSIQDATARRAFIDESCQNDASIRQQLECLVSAHFRAGDFLKQPIAGPTPAAQSCDGVPPIQENSSCEIGMRIGPYKIRELLGEGGMGIVYVAEQDVPVRRKVALKIIKPGMDSRDVIARFEAERQALTMMEHPNIARVLDAGTTSNADGGRPGLPYFVMELVKGLPITEYCDLHRLAVEDRLELFIQVCRAIQHAHQKAVIHRDLKPSNILVGVHDTTPVVKVIDFGVAKAIGSKLTDSTLYTSFNQLVGTPLYMSPEQAGQSSLDIDTRSDIYSLGVLLYELLIGSTPFDSLTLKHAGHDEMRRMIREVDPPRPSARISTLNAANLSTIAENRHLEPRRLSRMLRGELDWIVMKALEKDRNRRYATAGALSADIDRFLRHEPVDAGPPSKRYRMLKFARRHRVPLLVLACFVLMFTAASFISLRSAAEAHRADRIAASRLESEQALRLALQERERLLSLQLYASDLTTAWNAWIGGDQQRCLQMLGRHRPTNGNSEQDMREFAWHYLAERASDQPLTFSGHQSPILAADVSPDGRIIASSDRAGSVRIWQADTASQIIEWNYSNQEVTAVAFSPDGRWLATCGQDATVRLWSVDSWEEHACYTKHEHTVMRVTWSPDGRRLASSCRGGEIRIWDTTTGNEETSICELPDVVRCVAWSPDGTWLAAAVGPTLNIWNTNDWSLACSNNSLTAGVLAVAFSADGQTLAFAGYQGTVVICETRSGAELMRAAAIAGVWSLSFAPDGRHLLAGTGQGGPNVFRIHAKEGRLEMVCTAFEQGGTQRAVVFTNRSTVLTANEDMMQLRIWDFDARLGFRYTSYPGDCLSVLPVRQMAVTGLRDGTIELRGLSGGQDGSRLVGHQTRVILAAADTNEHWLATCAQDGELIVWNLDSGKEWLRMAVPKDSYELSFAPNGSTLCVASDSAGVQFWDAATGKLHAGLELPRAEVRTVAFSPDGGLMAAAAVNEPHIYLWDLRAGRLKGTLVADQGFYRLSFTTDGKQILAGGRTSDVQVWDVLSGREQSRLLGHYGPVRDLCISPDGRTLATLASDNAVRLWHIPTGQPLLTLLQRSAPHRLTFVSPSCLSVFVEHDSHLHRALATFEYDLPGQ
ncbi:MAG: serine/threonine protein kinase [Planctomycetales bacterium]|nr:serine/threonine protein kinase [Planctomycetales bacterium]